MEQEQKDVADVEITTSFGEICAEFVVESRSELIEVEPAGGDCAEEEE